jgi:hypothetical protein
MGQFVGCVLSMRRRERQVNDVSVAMLSGCGKADGSDERSSGSIARSVGPTLFEVVNARGKFGDLATQLIRLV